MNRVHLLRVLPLLVALTSGLAAPTESAAQDPDLIISSDPAGPPAVNRDQDTTVTVVVQNIGSGSVSALFDVTAYLSVDSLLSADDEKVGDASVSGTLDSSQTKTVDVPVSIPALSLAYGDYFWIVKVDQADRITEEDEANNARVGNAVSIVPGPPDLVVTSSPLGPATVAREGEYSLELNIQNAGLGPTTTSFDVSVYLSADEIFDEGDTRVGQSSVADVVSPGGTRTPEVDILIPAGQTYGSYFWLAVVDADTAHVESDETNNALAGSAVAVVEQIVDLVVASPPAGPNGVFRSLSYEVEVSIHNQGNGVTTADFDVVVYLSSNLTIGDADDVRMGDVAVTSQIDSGQVVTVQVPIQISALQAYGTYHWVVRLDDGGFLEESDETNNHLFGNVFSVAPSPSDIVVSVPPVGPSEVVLNETTTVQVSVANEGTGTTSGAFQVSIYLSADDSVGNADDVRVGGSSVTALLASGDSQLLDILSAIPTDQDVGTYRWLAIADANEVETEADETNNFAFSDSTVAVIATPPDLFILADPAGDPQITRGRQDTLTVLVRNQGEGSIEAGFHLAAYLSSDDTAGNEDDIKVGEHEVSRILTVGGEIAVGLPVMPPPDTELGTYRWVVVADPDNVFVETDETNNSRIGGEVTVIPIAPDLVVGGVLGPEQVALGEQFGVIVGVQNDGKGETLAAYDVTLYLSLDQIVGNEDDVSVGSLEQAETLMPDSTRFISMSADIPDDLPLAIYYWIVVVDGDNTIVESDESNNGILGNAVGFAQTSVDPEAIDFGEVKLGQVGNQTLIVSNDGDAPLSFDLTVTSTDVHVSPQSVSNLLPGEEWEVTITFTPSESGNFVADLQITGNGHPGVRTVELAARVPDAAFLSVDVNPDAEDQSESDTWMVPGRRLPLQLYVPTLPNSGTVTVSFGYDPLLMTFPADGFEPGQTLNGVVQATVEIVEAGVARLSLVAEPGGRIEGGYLGAVLVQALAAFADPSGSGPETSVSIVEVAYEPVNGEAQSIPVEASVGLAFSEICWADVDGSGKVAFPDFLALTGSFGKKESSTDWLSRHSRLDSDGDGQVAFSDFLTLIKYWGEICP